MAGIAVAFLYGIIILLSEPFLFPILGAKAETWIYLKEYVFWTIGVGAVPIAGSFISDADTVGYGQQFLKIICLACPTTAINFMSITVFQAIDKKIQPLFLSLLCKGSLDVVFMLLLNRSIGISGSHGQHRLLIGLHLLFLHPSLLHI